MNNGDLRAYRPTRAALLADIVGRPGIFNSGQYVDVGADETRSGATAIYQINEGVAQFVQDYLVAPADVPGLAAIATSGSATDLTAGSVPNARLTGNTSAIQALTLAANTFIARASTAALAAKPITDFGLSFVNSADAPTALTTIGAQPLDGTLTALAALTIAANSLTIGTAADAFSQTTFAANTFPAIASTGTLGAKPITDFGLSLVGDADASTARTTLGLGTAAIADTGLNGHVLPYLDTANVYSGLNTFNLGLTALAPISFKDSTDSSKVAVIGVATITTATTRTFSFPNASGVLMTGVSQATNLVPFASSGQVHAYDATGNTFAYTVAAGLKAGIAVATADPTSGNGPAWKLGAIKAAAVVLDASNYIEVSVGGTLKKVLIAA